MKINSFLVVLIFVFLAFALIQNGFIFYKTYEIQDSEVVGQFVNEGFITFCNNAKPMIINNSCNTTLSESTIHACTINGYDLNNDTLNFSYTDVGANISFVNVTSNGSVFIKTYIGNNTQNYTSILGNYSIWFTVSDGSGCSNYFGNAQVYNFEIIDSNDPPYLIQNIPNQIIPKNQNAFMFNLNNYFDDPDVDDVLTFNNSGNSP